MLGHEVIIAQLKQRLSNVDVNSLNDGQAKYLLECIINTMPEH